MKILVVGLTILYIVSKKAKVVMYKYVQLDLA